MAAEGTLLLTPATIRSVTGSSLPSRTGQPNVPSSAGTLHSNTSDGGTIARGLWPSSGRFNTDVTVANVLAGAGLPSLLSAGFDCHWQPNTEFVAALSQPLAGQPEQALAG